MGQGRSKPKAEIRRTVDRVYTLQENATKVLADEFLSKIPGLNSKDYENMCYILKKNLEEKIEKGEWLPKTVVDIILYPDHNGQNILNKIEINKCGTLAAYLLNLNPKIPAYQDLHVEMAKYRDPLALGILGDPTMEIENKIMALVKLTNIVKNLENKNKFIDFILGKIESPEDRILYIWTLEPSGYVKRLRGRNQYKVPR